MSMEEQAESNLNQYRDESRRGVLSNQDISREIENNNLIDRREEGDSYKDGVRGSCYDLRIGSVINNRLGIVEGITAVTLKPGEMVTLLSKERLKLPDNITGLVIPRNTLARRGILVLNAGHVDPNYSGQIMAQVVNLSNQERSIQLNDFKNGVISVVFDYLNSLSTIPVEPQSTTKERQSRLKADIGEQTDSLAIAEPVLRDRFVPRDRFTTLLWLNLVGFLAIIGIAVGILAGLATVTDSNINTEDWNWKAFGSVLLAVFLGATLAFSGRALVVGIYDWVRRNSILVIVSRRNK